MAENGQVKEKNAKLSGLLFTRTNRQKKKRMMQQQRKEVSNLKSRRTALSRLGSRRSQGVPLLCECRLECIQSKHLHAHKHAKCEGA
jgi:hypothetical protein